MKWEPKRLDAAAFEEVARQVGPAHVFQTAAWARVRELSGWRPHFFGIAGEERWEAALLCLERCKYGVSVMNVPRGPILRSGSGRPQALDATLNVVRSLARSRLAAFVKTVPDLVRHETWAEPIFRAAGARRSTVPTGHTSTLRLNLEPDEAQLLAQMESRTRYAIRKAEEAGVDVRAGADRNLLDDFCALYRQTCARAGISAMPVHLMAAMVETGIASIYVSYSQGDPVSGALMLRHGESAWYLLGGSRRGVKHTGAELLHWTAIREAKAAGVRTYDFQGIPSNPDKAHPLYGVYLFKRGFGGERIDLLGEFDLGSPPLLAGLGARAVSAYSSIRAHAHRHRETRI
ncbi:lipid II:glycine glycyltransferase FemX [Anaeromyxobacter terrae]|uniref:lipid II:glycine glycyltransferase FemX n=1 Tax=Anaeromyxobacter terrae TaxID=2925406 RepID=UPI001F57C756|nr:peptidoglycan bridge formation glycyltransferase FemA/FemB family protein [Anaeromyxobacter sp. SG22]